MTRYVIAGGQSDREFLRSAGADLKIQVTGAWIGGRAVAVPEMVPILGLTDHLRHVACAYGQSLCLHRKLDQEPAVVFCSAVSPSSPLREVAHE
jgi:hypothetical protein